MEVILLQASEFLKSPALFKIETFSIEEYQLDLRRSELLQSMERLEELGRTEGCKSGFWRRIKKAAVHFEEYGKAELYELEFQRALVERDGVKEGLVPVGVFETAIEAHLALSLIESEGLEGRVGDESLSQLAWHFGKAIGGVKLYVWDSDVEEAELVLDQSRKRAFARKVEEQGGVVKRYRTPWGAARVALLAMIMPPLAIYSLYLSCRVLFSGRHEQFEERERTNLVFAVCLSSLIIGTWAIIAF